MSEAFSPLCARSGRARETETELVLLNYRVKASNQRASHPPLLLFPSHKVSRNNPAEALGNGCLKTGPGIASGRTLQAGKYPEVEGLGQEQEQLLRSPLHGKEWDGAHQGLGAAGGGPEPAPWT